MTLIESFNYYIQRIEDFSISLPFFNKKIEIGFHEKTIIWYQVFAFFGCLVMGIFWVFTGYETTILRLFTKEFPIGVGIHYGTLIFTLGSFLVSSIYLEKAGITKLRNVLYSGILATGFLNGIFECCYTLLYDVIHHGEFWITAPFLYSKLGVFRLYPTYRNWYWLIFGFIFLWLIKGHYKKEGFKLKWNIPKRGNWLGCIGIILFICWIFWINYPFNFMIVRANNFPQYIYGFREYEQIPKHIPEENIVTLIETNWKAVYVPNLGVRIINEITKFIHFVFFTWLFIPKWSKIEWKNLC